MTMRRWRTEVTLARSTVALSKTDDAVASESSWRELMKSRYMSCGRRAEL